MSLLYVLYRTSMYGDIIDDLNNCIGTTEDSKQRQLTHS